ncbi:MAG: filamentous hemagglutinin N-terminal domain-containing protein, partial [Scytonema sp. PMC 1069.18]|nr:filamentous hemagglutinin N-terminal domain-containing protein [Scytonema sp. PMC 1069.18]
VLGSAIALMSNSVVAQITPDSTLPNNSIVTSNDSTFNITGGTTAGANLFHSFQDFSVPTGTEAFFNNAIDIQNIISRVTGRSVSNIDGLIRTLGTANLFLMNPNGIVFGPNASLNVGGSFVGTTANAIQFGDQGFFSATNPTSNPPLLTVNPSALFFNQIAATIQNRSTAPAGIAPTGFNSTGLRVPDGRSLLLVGGDINMDGGRLNAFGGRVELGGLTAPGTIGLSIDDLNLRLSYPVGVQRADVSLNDSAFVDVVAGNEGSIAVNARHFKIAGGSFLAVGIGAGLGNKDAQAGNIEIDASDTVIIDGTNSTSSSSRIVNNVLGNGNAGNVLIKTGSLNIIGNAQIGSATNGQGNAGSVTIQAMDTVSISGSGVLSSVGLDGVGNGSDINIFARSASLSDGAQVSTGTLGTGDSGNIFINVDNDISVKSGSFIQAITAAKGNAGNIVLKAGGTVSFEGSGAFTIVAREQFTFLGRVLELVGEGKGGNIEISADSLSVTNGARLQASTYGQGDAGNVIINVRDVSFDNGTAFSTVEQTGVGKGGNIQISADSLSLTNGAQLQALTRGQGDAGNVIINVRGLVSFDGTNTFAISRVEEGAVGKAGNIEISADFLSVTNGAQLQADTRGQGDAGNVIINVRGLVSFDGTTSDSSFPSGAFSIVEEGAVGKGGNVQISADSLSLTNSAILTADTRGKGDAGNVIINARGLVSFDGTDTYVLSTVEEGAVGNGGNIQISADSLSLTNGAQLQALTRGQGDAGNIDINAPNRVSVSGTSSITGRSSALATPTFTIGSGGNITVNTTNLRVSDGAVLSA